MGKIIQIEVPDWVDESIVEQIRKVVSERIDEIMIEAVWNKTLEKSKITDEDVEMLSEAIKDSAWKKLKEELKEKGLIND
ncbi:conserved hypothetical protein [Ferroglobus placidus DSM 10642]|uniref:Uncharacterized protein n=1 Tax=Ferroglobus placidus (strain DSM 10642 / AEDII12DO) TaxID=589924 RepID=D3S233_FERPA|nr:hypothetical protein [Ferroglobus placidus]ADC66524.1 conserved hypothetical protein [Ferroglobus placidus DSM 10642]